MGKFIVNNLKWKKSEQGDQNFILFESDGIMRRDGTGNSYMFKFWKRGDTVIKGGGLLVAIDALMGEYKYPLILSDTDTIEDYIGELIENPNGASLRSDTFAVSVEESSGINIITANTVLKDFMIAMMTQRVDLVAIGDSNQLFAGNGWDWGFQSALSVISRMYATGLIPFNSNNGTATEMGYKYDRDFAFGANSGAPAELAKFMVGPSNMHDYSYLTDAQQGTINPPTGVSVEFDCPINVKANLTAEFHYGTFISGVGEFKPAFMNFDDSGGVQSFPSPIQTVTGAETMQRQDLLKVAEPARTQGLKIVWRAVNDSGFFNLKVEGPFFGTYMRLINTDRNTGFSYGTIYDVGSTNLRDMALGIQNSSNDWYTYYFGNIRRIQLLTNSKVKIMVVINSGLNDRGETNPSVGPNPESDGDSPEAFKDNAKAIINKITQIWNNNGWSTSELYFMILVSHPQSDPDDTELVSYRVVAEELTNEYIQTTHVDISSLITSTDMTTLGYYDGAGNSHLSQLGYEQLSLLIFNSAFD